MDDDDETDDDTPNGRPPRRRELIAELAELRQHVDRLEAKLADLVGQIGELVRNVRREIEIPVPIAELARYFAPDVSIAAAAAAGAERAELLHHGGNVAPMICGNTTGNTPGRGGDNG